MDMGGRKVSKGVPSEEDFARASAAIKERSRGLSEVRQKILDHFRSSGELHEFFILDCAERSFRAYVFYPREKDVEMARKSGLESRVKDSVFKELANVGRGGRDTIEVKFEWDSHENVERHFEGNYFNRLR